MAEQFPSNYYNQSGFNTGSNILDIMGMSYGAPSFIPYQQSLVAIGSIIQFNNTLQKIQNIAAGEVNQDAVFKKKVPKELSYTTNVETLKDRMVLKLHSPTSKKMNPNIAGGDKITDVVKGLSNVVPAIGYGTDELKSSLKGLSSNDPNNTTFNLNKRFYTSGSTDSKFKIVYLPMPIGLLVDSHSHNLTGVAMNPAQAAFGLVATAGSVVGGLSTGGSFGGLIGNMSRGFTAPTSAIQYALNAVQLKSRKAVNPTMETLYNSPVPRQWQYTITYVPTNKKDADNFLEIIENIKMHSYPTLSGQESADLLYQYPGLVEFYFVINGQENRHSLPYSIKPCFIQSIQINYINESGTYTHYYDGNPTSINLTIELLETQLLTREDMIAESAIEIRADKEDRASSIQTAVDEQVQMNTATRMLPPPLSPKNFDEFSAQDHDARYRQVSE